MKPLRVLIYLLCATLLSSLVIPRSGPGDQSGGEQAWFDDFSSQDPRWDWPYHAGTGFHRLVQLPDAPSAVHLGITNETTSSAYSDSSLHEVKTQHSSGLLEMRLRNSDQDGKGTRGWGFWDGNTTIVDAAWFWYASDESDPILVELRAIVLRKGKFLLNQPLPNVDMRAWHIYRIERSSEGTKFFVDGNWVAGTAGGPANPQRIEIWTDNLQVNVSGRQYLSVGQDQSLYLDWVRFSEKAPAVIPSPSPLPPSTPTPSCACATLPYSLRLPLIVR